MTLNTGSRELVILSGVRTAFGTMSGALKGLTATDLAVPTATAALERAGVSVRSASDEPSVRAVISKVQLGIADAGIVYLTDARAAGARVRTVEIPARFNVRASYPIVATSTGERTEDAEAFVPFVLGADGRRVLEQHGFASP